MGLFRTHDACKAALKAATTDQFLYIVGESKRPIIVASHGGVSKFYIMSRVQGIDQEDFDDTIDFIEDGTLNDYQKRIRTYYNYD